MWALKKYLGARLCLSIVGLVLALTALMTLIDGVESARHLSETGVEIEDWLYWVGGKVPTLALSVLPVSCALGVALVFIRCRESGELVGLFSMGIKPTQIMKWTFFSVVISSLFVVLVCDAVKMTVKAKDVPLDEWVVVETIDEEWILKAGDRMGSVIIGLSFAKREKGAIVLAGEVRNAHYKSSGWLLDGISGHTGEMRITPENLKLPTLWAWEKAAHTPHAGSRLVEIFRSPMSKARTAWLGYRLMQPLAIGFMGAISFFLVLIDRRFGLGLVLVFSVVWTLFSSALVGLSARGQWPSFLALALPLTLICLLLALCSWVFDQKRGAYFSE